MTNMRVGRNEYLPDYAIPPGETLSETLEALGMSQAELARRMGRPRKTINEIIQGKAAITPDTALQLERTLGTPATFWNNLESQYQETLARIAEYERLEKQADWSVRFPVAEMCQRGLIADENASAKRMDSLLRFFGVASVERYDEIWESYFASVSFRQSAITGVNRDATAVWLRQGELEAQAIQCSPYDVSAFRDVLEQVRPLTTHPIEDVWEMITKQCAAAGVAVVIVPAFPNTGVWGVSRWVNPQKALIQLSLRYKSDDQFWFSFFHEAGHILLHGKSKLYIEMTDEGVDDAEIADINDEESEANRFAADFLIPPAELKDFLAQEGPYIRKDGVQTFAEKLGIAPGIVVGRLQHDGALPKSHLNGFKRKLRWNEDWQIETLAKTRGQ